MIYAQLSIFQIYSAFITASTENEFIKLFTDVIKDAVKQYEDFYCCSIGDKKDKIYDDMNLLIEKHPSNIETLLYDLTIDGNGWKGIVQVSKVYYNSKDVINEYQDWIDELNKDYENPEEQWAVFGCGFFPENPGYEIDYLFK